MMVDGIVEKKNTFKKIKEMNMAYVQIFQRMAGSWLSGYESYDDNVQVMYIDFRMSITIFKA